MKNKLRKILLILFTPILILISSIGIFSSEKLNPTSNEINRSTHNAKYNTDNISAFDFNPSVISGGMSDGSVEYDFSYQEDKYWYYDQKDFVKPRWRKTVEEVQPHWRTTPSGRWLETKKPPVEPINSSNIVLGLVPDSGPPTPGQRGVSLKQPNGEKNSLDKSTWVIKKGWKKYNLDKQYESENSYWNWEWKSCGAWQGYIAPEWGYGSDKGLWPSPTQELYSKRNREAWVEYTLKSHDNVLKTGKEIIERTIGTGPSFRTPLMPSIPSYNRFINKEPTWSQRELNGQQHDFTPDSITSSQAFHGGGGTKISFDNSLLIPGFQYDFNYKLMYKDSNGSTKEYDKGSHWFYTLKNAPRLNISYKNLGIPNNGTVNVNVEVIDSQSTRTTPVRYKMEELNGGTWTTIDDGVFTSDNFSKTYGNLEIGKKYQFTAWFDYNTTYNQTKPLQMKSTSGTIEPVKISKDQVILDIKGNWFENVVIIDYLVDSYYHNFWKYLSKIKIQALDGSKILKEKIITPLPTVPEQGWNQIIYKVPTSFYQTRVTLKLLIESNYINPNIIEKEIIIDKNPKIPIEYKIMLGDSTTTNSSIDFNYKIENLTSSPDPIWKSLEYRVKEVSKNWGEWISLPLKNSNSGTIHENNLEADTEYSFELKTIGPHGEKAFSNTYISKTTKEPKIDFFSTSPTYDSYKINFLVNNYIELVDKDFEWEIVNYDSKLVETGIYTIKHNEVDSINFDMLFPNTQYGVGVKYNDNGKTKTWTDIFKTKPKPKVSGSGYVIGTGEDITPDNKLIVESFGDIRTIKISEDNKTFIDTTWMKGKKDLLNIDVSPLSNIGNVVYVKVNNTTLTKIMVKSDTTIGSIRLNLNYILPIILISLFSALGIGLIIGWGVISLKKNNKNKQLTNEERTNNIWLKAKKTISKKNNK